jgi:hypothetical protein
MSFRYYDSILAYTRENLTKDRKQYFQMKKCMSMLFEQNTKLFATNEKGQKDQANKQIPIEYIDMNNFDPTAINWNDKDAC